MVLARQPFEELSDAGQIMVLARRAQGLTARLTIGVEVLLITRYLHNPPDIGEILNLM